MKVMKTKKAKHTTTTTTTHHQKATQAIKASKTMKAMATMQAKGAGLAIDENPQTSTVLEDTRGSPPTSVGVSFYRAAEPAAFQHMSWPPKSKTRRRKTDKKMATKRTLFGATTNTRRRMLQLLW